MAEKTATRALYSMSFLLNVHIALTVFFNSSLLVSRGVAQEYVGLVYVLGSVANMVILFFSSKILRRFGNYATTIFVGLLQVLLFVGIALFPALTPTLVLFILSFATATFLFFSFDIFLETYTKSEESTGEKRGILLTAINSAFVISPLVAGWFLGDDNFATIYLVSAAFVVPVLFIMHKRFKHFADPQYHTLALANIVRNVFRNQNIRCIFMVQFLLRFFYAAMTIYMPLHLAYLGFPFSQIGIIFSIMLLPFVLLEYPLGKFADTYWGEKELLVVGFVILIGSVALIPFVAATTIVAWAGLLFATRVGAATIEVMNEIYFFKHVGGDDTDTISAFRMVRPVAYILGPAMGSVVLFFTGTAAIFGALAFVLLLGIFASLRLEDTR